ncbi:MAG TPA: Lrp/AsnC family transcriptional regulator [Acidobacteriaceae bacterium]|jgi:DNA-binding Lrp family transcriptional regulator|nr:Lrp/AsnC family transcriptional regulator [Acidobacteriaceae bacterium]
MRIDQKDVLLIEALQQDASKGLEELARLVHLAPSSVHDRLRRLQQDGIIRGWTIKVDAAALGLEIQAFIGIQASRPCEDLVEELRAVACIEECHSVAGDLSMLLKVRVPHPIDLMDLTEKLRQIPGIDGTRTTIVLKTQIDRPARRASSTGKKSLPAHRTGPAKKSSPR